MQRGRMPRLVVIALAVGLLGPLTVPRGAAAFPDRDITLVVPWAAGGGTDTLARTLVRRSPRDCRARIAPGSYG